MLGIPPLAAPGGPSLGITAKPNLCQGNPKACLGLLVLTSAVGLVVQMSDNGDDSDIASPSLPAMADTKGTPGPDCPPGIDCIGGEWENVSESMSDRARAYQEQVTGRSGQSYVKDGVKFDGMKDGVFMDAKGPGYARFVKNGEFRSWYRGKSDLVDQATRQVNAAGKNQIEWHVAEESAANAMRNLLNSEGITGIRIIHTPFVP
jgi:hypothetical protein